MRGEERALLYPYALIEPIVDFAALASQICRLAGFDKDVRFFLGLYNIHSTCLLPYAPDTFGFLHGKMDVGKPYGPQPFPDDHLKVRPVTVRASSLPGTVTWDLVSQVYHRFGHQQDEEIPFFDSERHCTLGWPQQEDSSRR